MKVLDFLSSGLFASTALALGQAPTINFDGDGMELASGGSAVDIMCDNGDWPAVLRVCNDLAWDFGRVTGTNGSVTLMGEESDLNASMIFNVTGRDSFAIESTADSRGGVIIAGTVGNSSMIDGMVEAGLIDVGPIEGEWEAYTSLVVDNPMEGVEWAMVIAGSDRRGTVYGLYSVSEQIGVSPWYYMADSPPQAHDSIYAQDVTVVQGSPSVRFRGFFINDEAPALTGYIMDKFPPGEYGPGYNSDFYHSVLELLLRLRANYLWPAMWNSMYNVDDPRNQPLADQYAIVMGSSHTEPMARATKEWNEFGDGDWFWGTNNESIYDFFVEGAQRAQPYDTLYTMGMRGSHDTPISDDIETELLEDVVRSQREILAQIHGNETMMNPEALPQMWCLYKEVQGYYEAGMTVEDDITLLWADDNFGNNRRLPVGNETERSGGAGVYYHFDYVGDPRSYKWINTVQMAKTWEQMYLAYERQARTIWVVNVGDIKPKELPISHFMDLAYDIERWNKDSTAGWLQLWAAREFGMEVAQETGALMNNYSQAVGKRKFEHTDPSIYNIFNYNEAERVLGQWRSMAQHAQSIMDSLPDATQPAFFEMVYHPVTAGYVYHDIMISTARNNIYALQGRTSANTVAQHVLDLFEQDQALTARYNGLLGGKWNHMMDQTHIGYEYWQQPMRQAVPGLQYVAAHERGLVGDMALSIQNSNASVPGDDQFHDLGSNSLTMMPFDPYGVSEQWIDIYLVGVYPFDWNITANATWVHFSESSGHISPNGTTDVRIWASIDWENCPEGSEQMVQVNVTRNDLADSGYFEQALWGAQFNMPQLMLPVNHTVLPDSFANGHVESDGHISIEAEHWSEPVASADNSTAGPSYEIIPGLGRTLSGVTLFPVAGPSLSADNAPGLSYNLYTFSEVEEVNITVVTTAALNTIPDRPLQYAIQLDDQEAQTVQYIEDQAEGVEPVGWLEAVANNAWTSMSTFEGGEPGEHVLRLWALEPGLVFTSIWLDMGGLRESYLGPPESYWVD